MEINQMNLSNQDSTTSPFDAIKQSDGTNEWWSARDLMGLLGYEKWERFEARVSEAATAADLAGVQNQFPTTGKMVTVGSGAVREVSDYSLSRYACYMVALSCDGRKQEVADAKTYFAIRTREAEVSQPRELTGSELLAKALVEAHRVIEEAEARAELEAAKVRELTPAANAWAQFLSSTGDVSVNEAAKALSRNSAHVLGERKLRALLEKWGWVYRDHKRRPRAYQSQIDNGRLAERARTYQD